MAQLRCDFPPNPAAEKLVADYLAAVIRAASAWQSVYPHEDIEYIFVGALYRAAWTWRPGKASFWRWWNLKARGALATLRRRRDRGLQRNLEADADSILEQYPAPSRDCDAALDAPVYLSKLPDRESRCIRQWLEGKTMKEIGECEGCCGARVGQLIKEAHERMRR